MEGGGGTSGNFEMTVDRGEGDWLFSRGRKRERERKSRSFIADGEESRLSGIEVDQEQRKRSLSVSKQ